MQEIVNGTLGDGRFTARYAEPMFRLRYRVFHERLGWDVRAHDGLETDEYDDLASHYLLAVDDGAVVGGWRLRPTTRPYMLAEVFPQLLGGQPAPCRDDIWEISRFAVDTDGDRHTRFGLNGTARGLLRATAQFAVDRDIGSYVMVASAGAERLYRNAGLVVRRFAAPQRIGRVMSVACWVDIDAHTREVLLGRDAALAAAA